MFNSLTDMITLNNKVKIPCVGFGTWQTPSGEVAYHAVREALDVGFRHIDTAYAYDNEESVGKAINESGLPRDQIFLTTKLVNTSHGYDATLECCEKSLKNLGMDYIDLYLVHWPNPQKFRDSFKETNAETWRAMEKLYKDGKVRAIGISNYRPHHIEALLKTATVMPAVNQIRLYPGFPEPEVVRASRSHGIYMEAYSPLGTGKVLKAPELKAIAEKHGKSVAQVALRWSLQMDFLPLPKSVTDKYIKENTQIFDFALDDEDMQAIAGMPNYGGPGDDPDTAPF